MSDDEIRLKRESPRLTVTLDPEPDPYASQLRTIDLSGIFPVPDEVREHRRRLVVEPDAAGPQVVVRLGTGDECDVRFDHPTVSPVHAEVRSAGGRTEIIDLSHGGTGVVVNGRYVRRREVHDGDEIGVGPYRYQVRGEQLVPRELGKGARLCAVGVGVAVGPKVILQPTWLTFEPGELVAIIGESGAGKSTLMKALAGINRPGIGAATFDGDDVRLRRQEIGYVPQDEIVHGGLTVAEALRFAAALRLPQDARRQARQEAVRRVIAEVGLEAHATTMVSRLSGGQRKRAGVATELVSRPRLLCLDEPTTGLDPGLEHLMMERFAGLARAGRTVLLVTHATKNLSLCDRVVVMARGGVLAFSGPPTEALRFFGVESFDDVYRSLDQTPAQTWHARYRQRPEVLREWGGQPARPTSASIGRAPRRRALPQWWSLTRRYVKLFLRDRRTVATLILQAPVLGVAAALLFKPEVFAHGVKAGSTPAAGQTAQLLFFMVTIALWFGAIGAAREIIKERTVHGREAAVGVRTRAYLMSKLTVLVPAVAIQTVVFVGLVLLLRDPHEPLSAVLALSAILVATSVAGLASGLLVSVFARSEDQATSAIPLLLLPQLLFAGAIVPVAVMSNVMEVLSGVVFARWAFKGAGSVLELDQRMATDTEYRSQYGAEYFDMGALVTVLLLAFFCVVFLLFVAKRLRSDAGVG